MKILKSVIKLLFYKYYQIKPLEQSEDVELSFACDGRIVRSLTDSKKKVCGTYILNGVER
ncbi:hypothetical protein K040078D81_43560 [Blautia hominis]|uniref:Uncharacterized protein n=1 Tax=Blautia hominis TaxID=2025493 RepID=A0ABQ0BFP0_9FIRM